MYKRHVLYFPKEKRTFPRSGATPSALNTCEPTLEPLEQALPPDTEMPEMSRLNSSMSLRSDGGRLTLSTVSYTHLDVYKRQPVGLVLFFVSGVLRLLGV